MQRYRIHLATAIVVLVTAMLAFVVISPNFEHQTATPTPSVSPETTKPPTIAELLNLVNAERQRVGVAPLVEDSRLDQSAQRKADDMVKYNYFGHISPNDGKHGYQYINDVGISCRTDGENLNETTGDLAPTTIGFVNSWINSAPHHAAMINPDYSLTGFGINGNKVVEHFCQVG